MDECKPLPRGRDGVGARDGRAGRAVYFRRRNGGAVQVDPMKAKLKPPVNERSKLKCDIPLLNSAFKFKLRRYTMGRVPNDEMATVPRQGLTLVHFSAQPEPILTQNTP